MGFEKYKQRLENLKADRAENFDRRTDGENYLVDQWIKMTAEVCRDFRAMEESSNESAALPLHIVSERTLGINSCASLIKSMPIDQAIQIMKSDITGQPQTSVIDGQLVVAYVR